MPCDSNEAKNQKKTISPMDNIVQFGSNPYTICRYALQMFSRKKNCFCFNDYAIAWKEQNSNIKYRHMHGYGWKGENNERNKNQFF